jgi:hypothetical protein
MASYEPTVNVSIDKIEETPPADISSPAAICPLPASNETLKLVGASFCVGVLMGGMLVFAFSKTPPE